MKKLTELAQLNFRNLYKLMNCRVNTTYFVKNGEERTPWKQKFFAYLEIALFCWSIFITFFKYFTEAHSEISL